MMLCIMNVLWVFISLSACIWKNKQTHTSSLQFCVHITLKIWRQNLRFLRLSIPKKAVVFLEGSKEHLVPVPLAAQRALPVFPVFYAGALQQEGRCVPACPGVSRRVPTRWQHGLTLAVLTRPPGPPGLRCGEKRAAMGGCCWTHRRLGCENSAVVP